MAAQSPGTRRSFLKAAALLANQSYHENRQIGWDPISMTITG